MDNSSQINVLIKNSGLKITPKRISVLNFLMEIKKPVTVDEISKQMKLNIVTTYRILESFVEKKIIYQTDFRSGKAFFEFQSSGHHHHHVVCKKCGFREHVDICIEKDFLNRIIKNSSFKNIDDHVLEFFGICKKCKN